MASCRAAAVPASAIASKASQTVDFDVTEAGATALSAAPRRSVSGVIGDVPPAHSPVRSRELSLPDRTG